MALIFARAQQQRPQRIGIGASAFYMYFGKNVYSLLVERVFRSSSSQYVTSVSDACETLKNSHRPSYAAGVKDERTGGRFLLPTTDGMSKSNF